MFKQKWFICTSRVIQCILHLYVLPSLKHLLENESQVTFFEKMTKISEIIPNSFNRVSSNLQTIQFLTYVSLLTVACVIRVT